MKAVWSRPLWHFPHPQAALAPCAGNSQQQQQQQFEWFCTDTNPCNHPWLRRFTSCHKTLRISTLKRSYQINMTPLFKSGLKSCRDPSRLRAAWTLTQQGTSTASSTLGHTGSTRKSKRVSESPVGLCCPLMSQTILISLSLSTWELPHCQSVFSDSFSSLQCLSPSPNSPFCSRAGLNPRLHSAQQCPWKWSQFPGGSAIPWWLCWVGSSGERSCAGTACRDLPCQRESHISSGWREKWGSSCDGGKHHIPESFLGRILWRHSKEEHHYRAGLGKTTQPARFHINLPYISLPKGKNVNIQGKERVPSQAVEWGTLSQWSPTSGRGSRTWPSQHLNTPKS